MTKKILYSKKFLKHYRQRIQTKPFLVRSLKQRLSIFLKDSQHPLLKNHSLKGIKKNLRSFSITGDYRLIYQEVNSSTILLIDNGTHNQVY